jgi:hypothetical protein
VPNDDRPAAYEEEGKVVYRASSFGGCLTMLAGLRLGYEPSPPPEKMVQGAFARGHELEVVALKKLKVDGWEVKSQQKQFDLVLTSRAVVRCHVDALSAGPLIEVKSQSQEEYEKWRRDDPWGEGLWPKYAWQVSALMLATGRHCALVRITPELDFDQFIVQEPPHSLTELRQRHFAVEKIVHSGALPMCTTISYPCPLWRTHPSEEEPVLELKDQGIDENAKIYDHASREVKKWDEIKLAARRALRIGIVEDRIRTQSGIIVTFSQAKLRKLSEKLIRERGIDPEEVKEETISERITVTVPGEEKGKGSGEEG